MKVSIEASGLYTYPDAVVVCGADRPDVRDANAVTNPALVVEITSNSTEDYDCGAKLAHSQQIDALQSVLIVSHCRRCLTVVSRTAAGWVSRDFDAGTSALVATLSVDEVCASVSSLNA